MNRNQKDSSQVKSSLAPSENQDNELDYIIYKDQVNKYINCKYPSFPDSQAEKLIKPPTEQNIFNTYSDKNQIFSKSDKYKYGLKQCSYPRNLTTRDIIGAVPGTLKSKVVQNFEKHHMMNDQTLETFFVKDYDQQEYNSSPQRNENAQQYSSNNNKTDATPEKEYNFNEVMSKRNVYDKSYIQEINQKLPQKIIHSPDLKKSSDEQNNYKPYYPKISQENKNEIKSIGQEVNQLYKMKDRQNSPQLNPSYEYQLYKKNQFKILNISQNVNKRREENIQDQQKGMNQKSKYENLSQDEIQRLINEYQKGYTSKLVNQYQAKNYDIINFYNREDWRNNKNPNYVKIQSFPKTNVFTFLENGDMNFNSPDKNRNKFTPQQFYSEQKPRPYLQEDFINNHNDFDNDKLPKILNTNKSYDSKQINRHQRNQSVVMNKYENAISNQNSKQYQSLNYQDNKDILDYQLSLQNNQNNEIISPNEYLQPNTLISKKRSISVNNNLYNQSYDLNNQRKQYEDLLASKGANNIFNLRQSNGYQPRRPY